MPYGWEGKHRSGVALATRHRHQWFSTYRLEVWKREMSTPTMLSCRAWSTLPLPLSKWQLVRAIDMSSGWLKLTLNVSALCTCVWYSVLSWFHCVEWQTLFSIQCFDTVGWATGRASDLWKAGCWFVGGDDLTDLIWHILYLQLSSPLSLSLAPIKPVNPGLPRKMAVKIERERENDGWYIIHCSCLLWPIISRAGTTTMNKMLLGMCVCL